MARVRTARAWTARGTELLLEAVAALPDAQWDRVVLPGWTARHVVGHVHFNALALGRLAQWAATGVEARMYASPEQRAAEIEYAATRSAGELRGLVRDSAQRLDAALAALSPPAWASEVVTAQGRTVPASEIPWLRAREVCVHAVDLGGAGFADLPEDFVTALLVDVVGKRASAGQGPALAAWLTGRSARPPELGRWL